LENWNRVLTLSALRADEQVVIVDRWAGPGCYKNVAAMACEQLGASVVYVEVPDPDRLPASVVPLLNAADLVIDLVFIHDSRIHAARETGTRVLLVLEPPEILERLIPTPNDKAAALHAVERIRAARHMHVTSPAGTDLCFEIGQYRVNCQYGYADTPGRWDQWPGAFVSTFANDGSGDGRVVFDRGDMMFPFHRYFGERVELEIEAGWIRHISGGYEADLLRSYMERYESPDVYALSHLGWGLSRNARWETLAQYPSNTIEGQDGRAFAGNFLFSTGPNATGGGTRKTPCHVDMPMRNCTVRLDGTPVVVDGKLVEEAPLPLVSA
ncbi:MAG: 2,5-dihydroxypyridine 5,6-dioxygenase, partial [Acetobacteraceae bacterium]|nr:2,5-dihydroxypyridine 5,6-dioxygenase [Acetobacteraceae bacterium]